MSFGIESPSWFEPSLTFQVLLFSLFSFATYTFAMLAGFPRRALWFCLCSQLLFVWTVPPDLFYWSKCYAIHSLGPQLFCLYYY